MQTSSQLLTEQDIIRLLTTLCEVLSQNSRSAKHCSSERLLDNAELRNSFLRQATQSEDHKLRRMAYKLLRVDFEKVFGQTGSVSDVDNVSFDNNQKTKSGKLQSHSNKNNKQLVLLKGTIAGLSLVLIITLAMLFRSNISHLFNQRVEVSDSITQNTTWTADKEYILRSIVYVEQGAKLTIEAGTQIKGDKGTALIITRDSQLIASGSPEHPVIFSSNKSTGERKRGDWGGVVLLGNAPINRGESAHIEGIPGEDVRGDFGGADSQSSCGVLQYVRIEFAGYEVYTDNELNGLTLGGCGSSTIVRYVQIHKALDDGIEVFGGSVNMKNIVVTGAKDDSFDWDMGWQGKVQFLIVQLHIDGGDNGFEGDNFKKNPLAEPVSKPAFYNVTMIGANNSQISQRAMNIRRGSGGTFSNFIISGFSNESVDLRGNEVANLVENGDLNYNNILFYSIGKNGKQYFSIESDKKDDDKGFIEADYLTRPHLNNKFGFDPRLPVSVYNPVEPDFTPYSHSPARESKANIPQGEFWDEGANYLGAIRPGIASNWLQGWTSFPVN